MVKFKVREGRHFGNAHEHAPGDVVEFEDAQAGAIERAFGDLLERVVEEKEVEPAKEPVKGKAAKETENPPPPPAGKLTAPSK